MITLISLLVFNVFTTHLNSVLNIRLHTHLYDELERSLKSSYLSFKTTKGMNAIPA
jgi:hypothetical protein